MRHPLPTPKGTGKRMGSGGFRIHEERARDGEGSPAILRRSHITLLVAALLHVGAFTLVRSLPPPPSPPSSLAASPSAPVEPTLQDITIVSDDVAPAADPPVEQSAPGGAELAERAVPSTREGSNRSLPTASGGEAPSARATEATEATEASGEPNGPLVFTKPGSIGLEGTNPFLAPGALASVEPEHKGGGSREASNERAREMLKGSGRARDLSLGLGSEGPVLRALGDATTASLAPVKGRAVFVVDTNASGEVISVDVGDTNGDRPGWLDAARIALDALKGKKLVMRGGPSATRMHIEVVSASKMPSGSDPGLDVDVLGIPLKKGEGPASPRVSLLDPRTGTIVAAFGDLSDLGAKARRIVHTRVLDATPL